MSEPESVESEAAAITTGRTPELRVLDDLLGTWTEDFWNCNSGTVGGHAGNNCEGLVSSSPSRTRMARGADVTVHAADVVVLAPRLDALGDAVGLSRATLARIRENLGFALAYNAIAVPLAMAGILGPLGAAIAMGLSSLVVTRNSVRLLRWSPPS